MNEELKTQLQGMGFNEEQISKLEAQGVTSGADLALLSLQEIRDISGCTLIAAKKAVSTFGAAAPAPAAVPDEIPEGTNPTPNQVNAYASQMGIDPSMLTMLMFGGMAQNSGIDMDLSGMIPVPQIVGGYNPKIRNFPYLIMGQIERRLGTPIVVINADGSVNVEHTTKYIMSLEEGFEPAEDGVYYDQAGAPFEIYKVGVDAQGIYDADPVNSSRALHQNGMGVGRINWHDVSLDVRQVVYFAANQTGELNPSDEAMLARLRDKISPTATRLSLRGDFPKAMAAYNEALRTGSLPTLRVQLSRAPRRPNVMPRRRTLGDNQRRIIGDPGDSDK